jgi:phage-related protein
MKKLINLLNPKKWLEGFLLSAFAKKFVTGAVVSALAYLGPYLTKLSEHGVKVDVDAGAAVTAIIAVIGGILNGMQNVAKHGPLKSE